MYLLAKCERFSASLMYIFNALYCFFCAKQDYFANKSDNSCRIISLHTHFFGNKIVVLFVVNWIIPTAKLMEDLSSKALLNL